MYGSVRGVPGNWHPYRDPVLARKSVLKEWRALII
jgi:hypothetical protein